MADDKRVTIIALITALVGLSSALVECSAKSDEAARRAEADALAKQSMEQARVATDRANQAEAARQKLAEQQDSIRRFMANYGSHLQDIKNKQSRLDEIRRSRSQEGLSQAQADLASSVQSYVKFVKDWRTVHRELASLLDGDVTAMEDAPAVGDLAEIQRRRDVLAKNIMDKQAVLKRRDPDSRHQQATSIRPQSILARVARWMSLTVSFPKQL